LNWRLLTAFLLCCTFGLAAWIYVRDSDYSPVRLPERRQAQDDATEMLGMVSSGSSCERTCAAEVVRRIGGHVWRVMLETDSWSRCFDLTVTKFGLAPTTGFHGIQSTPCAPR
jgi:hypothetical protein